jgi:uncharacterized protein (DUF2336 family)
MILTLAHDDEIAAARPVIAQSPRLSEQDLVSVARSKGADHMLALSQRQAIPCSVTDILLDRGDRAVMRSVARNPTARLSMRGVDALVRQARADDELRSALGARRDIPATHLRDLLAMAKEAVRAKLRGSFRAADQHDLDAVIERSTADVVMQAEAARAPRRLEEAMAAVNGRAGISP